MDWMLIWLVCIGIATAIGSSKGEAGTGFIAGLIFGPLGVLFAQLSSGYRRPCPHSKEKIMKDAAICTHCRTQLKPAG